MLIAMYKIWVLLLCVNCSWCTVHEENNQGTCNDCVPILECKEASPYLNPSDETMDYINKFFCGITEDSFKVCCSKLKDSLSDKPHPNLKLLPDNCGKIYRGMQSRIIGGIESGVYEFPWMVLISYNYRNSFSFKCSGTLINSRYVLTAAHCVHNADIAGIRIGEHQIGTSTDCKDSICASNIQDKQVNETIIHDDYDPFDETANDIALIRLVENVDLTFLNTGTICLPITEELQSRTITSRFGTVAGWGVTEYGQDSSLLLKVTVPIRSNKQCQKYYSNITPSDKKRFCAGQHDTDSCQGDSGGPLMITDSYKGTIKTIQYGIVSYGAINCGSDTPGVYTNVRNYMKWILDNIRE